MNLTLYNNVYDKSGKQSSIEAVFEMMDSRELFEKIRELRATEDKARFEQLKKYLPAVTWSGKFDKRKGDLLKQHSGLICMDIDKLPAERIAELSTSQVFHDDPALFCYFISPSGTGFKLIYRIDPAQHAAAFDALAQHIAARYQLEIDPSGSDVNRLCFLSYPAPAYLNRDANPFTVADHTKKPGRKKAETATIPTASKAIQQAITRTNKKNTYVEGERNNYLFYFARNCNLLNVPEAETLAYALTHFADLEERELHDTVASGYKTSEDKKTAPVITATAVRPAKKEDTPLVGLNLWDENYCFYAPNFDAEGNPKGIKLHRLRLLKVLKKIGLRRLTVGNSTYIVHLQNNIIAPIDGRYIKAHDLFYKHLLNALAENDGSGLVPIERDAPDGVPVDMVLNLALGCHETGFKESIMMQLPECNAPLGEDNKDSSVFYYRNGFVRVAKDGLTFHDYSELRETVIWEDSILPRDFTPLTGDQPDPVFFDFLKKLAGEEESRLISLLSIIGSRLHKYFGNKRKAVIFTDSVVSDDPKGRTGKSIICKGIEHMLNRVPEESRVLVELNGKTFNEQDPKKYREADISTKVILIQDAKKDLDFESFFTEIADKGIRIQRNYEEPITKKVHFIFTTNKLIKLKGDSARDRVVEYEVSSYFGAHRSPADEYGHWFFNDWNAEEWNRFDNLMLSAVTIYFNKGLIVENTAQLTQRKMHEEVGKDLCDFLSDFPNKPHHIAYNDRAGIIPDYWYCKKDLYRQFCELAGHKLQDHMPKWFGSKLRLYKQYHPDYVADRESPVDGSYAQEKRSNGKDLIQFILTPQNQ